jgi:primosomal protein N' (replication factor Y)
MAKFARVIIDQSVDREFDYAIPEDLRPYVKEGSRVRVPLRSRNLLATVVALLDETNVPGIKSIESLASKKQILTPVLLKLAHWIADYYCCPVEAAMRAVLPQVIRKAEVGFKEQVFARLVREPSPEELAALQKKAPRQADVITYLMQAGEPVSAAQLSKVCGAGTAALRALERRGYLTTLSETLLRDPSAGETYLQSAAHTLNSEQSAVLEVVKKAIANPSAAKPLLLYGVTGSGKTEIYLQAIEETLKKGKTALVLVPEISLTPQTVERFKSRFAAEQNRVAVLHSHLSHGERHDEWHRIHDGLADIVIGARSAVFAPLENLGLIVVDEEHENSYKQEETPHYHARDIAVLRARMEGAAIVLGSATPSLESYQNALSGKYELLTMRSRVDDRKLPLVRVVDMRLHGKRSGGPLLISQKLRTAVEARLQKREQVILFLNRRGFATALQCPKCGHVCQCPNCSISLTYHRKDNKLSCHLCGYHSKAPSSCPECREPGIKYSGAGTEKIEDAVARVFPKARVARMDADTMTRKDAYRETLGAFKAGKIDILVGTQMIAKGLHFPNVTLVGIVSADIGLHMPDFRAGERTFQLLTQVAGRAGRGDVDGEVLVQTYTPHSPSIQFARKQDFEAFAEQELSMRAAGDLPPYSHMILVTVRSTHERRASFTAETLERKLRERLPEGVSLSIPAPAPLSKINNQYRFHLSLRSRSPLKMSRFLKEILRLEFPEDVFVTADVDPFHLL